MGFETSESSERGRLSRRVELGGSSRALPEGRLASLVGYFAAGRGWEAAAHHETSDRDARGQDR